MNAWTHAVYALVHQESYWTHYRLASDRKIKMMRGDSGHGHGLMQLDDRAHTSEIQSGDGWDIAKNIKLGFDIFYNEWQHAASANCSGAGSDKWLNRARAAYARYNGGAICRWTQSNASWGQNDKGFLEKWQNKDWERATSNPNQPAPFNIACMMQSGSNCLASESLDLAETVAASSPIASGDWIRIVAPQGIHLRATPEGELMAQLPYGSVWQVSDTVISGDEGSLYLKLESGGQVGYIYTGYLKPQSSISLWVERAK